MEPVIFWTTLSAFLGSACTYPGGKVWMNMMRESASKFSKMKASQAWFTIKLDNKTHSVARIVQSDESVIFIVDMDGRKIELYKGENENWIGSAEQTLVDRIGSAIENA